jgi:hypothetical protein
LALLTGTERAASSTPQPRPLGMPEASKSEPAEAANKPWTGLAPTDLLQQQQQQPATLPPVYGQTTSATSAMPTGTRGNDLLAVLNTGPVPPNLPASHMMPGTLPASSTTAAPAGPHISPPPPPPAHASISPSFGGGNNAGNGNHPSMPMPNGGLRTMLNTLPPPPHPTLPLLNGIQVEAVILTLFSRFVPGQPRPLFVQTVAHAMQASIPFSINVS